MFGFSAISEFPLSTQENDGSVVLAGQSLTTAAGSLDIAGAVLVTGLSADILLGQYPVWIPVPTGPVDVWTTVST